MLFNSNLIHLPDDKFFFCSTVGKRIVADDDGVFINLIMLYEYYVKEPTDIEREGAASRRISQHGIKVNKSFAG